MHKPEKLDELLPRRLRRADDPAPETEGRVQAVKKSAFFSRRRAAA